MQEDQWDTRRWWRARSLRSKHTSLLSLPDVAVLQAGVSPLHSRSRETDPPAMIRDATESPWFGSSLCRTVGWQVGEG